MKMENVNKWKSAATDGLILSAVTIVYGLITNLLNMAGGGDGFTGKGIITVILWLAKFSGALYLLFLFMKQYASKFETLQYGAIFGYGSRVCIFSSIVCACWGYFSMVVLFPKQTSQAMDQIMSVASQYDESQMEAMQTLFDHLPQISLFGNLLYCIIFGIIAAAIIANFTKKVNPFDNPNETA